MINKRLASATESRVGINQESPTAASQTPHCCFAIHSDVLSYIALSDIVLHCDMLSNTILDFRYICTLVVFCFLLYLHVCLSIYQHTSVHRVPIPYGATSIQYSLVCLSSCICFCVQPLYGCIYCMLVSFKCLSIYCRTMQFKVAPLQRVHLTEEEGWVGWNQERAAFCRQAKARSSRLSGSGLALVPNNATHPNVLHFTTLPYILKDCIKESSASISSVPRHLRDVASLQ